MTLVSIGLWALRNWKWIAGGAVLLAVAGLVVVLRLELMTAEARLAQAGVKVETEKQRADAAAAEVARQQGFVAELTAVNQRNAVVMADYRERLQAQRAAADATAVKLSTLQRSYAGAIKELRDAKQQSAPLSAFAARGLVHLRCLQQRQGDFDACADH